MSIVSSTIKNKKKVICHVPTASHFADIKPIEVKCFLDENRITIESCEKPQTDVTATMLTIVPQSKRPITAPIKKQTITHVTDMIVAKPIRHLAILPSSKEQLMKRFTKSSTNLSETFTMYEGPPTTPNVGRSLDETMNMKYEQKNENQLSDLNFEIPINAELKIDDLNLCDSTPTSSICELVDQPKLQQKPHSLIGRYQLPTADTSSKPPPSVHIATVHYGETQPAEAANKQVLIQQFYTQLEKMKAVFNTEQAHQITTNTLTFDNGQVQQTLATNQLKEKIITKRVPSTTVPENNKKPPIPKKPKKTKNSSTRIQSAPVRMATQSNKIRNPNPILSCKKYRIPIPPKKSIQTKDKQIRRVESAPLNRIELHGSEVTLLPQEEQECRQMFEKLQRLQPNGVCVDMNTLRRALYPPVGMTTYSSKINHDQTTPYRPRAEEMPQSWIKVDNKYVSQYVPKQQQQQPKLETNTNESNRTIPSDNTNIDRIADQVKKHAAINYSYYTRTK